MKLFRVVAMLYNGVFLFLQRVLEDWFLGLAARLVFGSALAMYFWSLALGNVRSATGGALDYLTVEAGAYAQIAPTRFAEVEGDPARMSAAYDLLVQIVTFGEFALPALILIGLLTRLASAAMIGLIAYLSWVETTAHSASFGLFQMFDKIPTDLIADQRLLWTFPLLYLVIRGAGAVSLDWLIRRAF